ncbi:MAG TPA: hypothetical protein VK919_04685 [Solirubrobacterales bacterium]|nr:hypothetical protein [Solirubrobacterales bacterium]
MNRRPQRFAQRLLGAVDRAIDFATLGEYGLETVPADGPCRERPGRNKTGWEALARPAAGRGREPRRAPAGCARSERIPAAAA